MEKLSDRKTRILEALDEEIGELEQKLKKVQPLIDELNQLKRTRATLLSERTTTGSVGGARITMESVIHALTEGESMTVAELAAALGQNDTAVRSHLNRHKDVRYRKVGDEWALIGEDDGNDDEEEDD